MKENIKDKTASRSGLVDRAGGPYNNRALDFVRLAFWILLVVGVGMFAVNQGLGFVYHAHFLKAPCNLCAELNPGVQSCIDNLNGAKASYWNGENWTDPFTEQTYNLTLPNQK